MRGVEGREAYVFPAVHRVSSREELEERKREERGSGRVLINGWHCAWHVYSGRNPLEPLLPSILFQGGRRYSRTRYLPLASCRFLPPSILHSSSCTRFSFFFFYFREFSQKRHANTRSASDQLCRADESRRETLEFWLNTVLLMDGASGSGSWKHVMRLSDRW